MSPVLRKIEEVSIEPTSKEPLPEETLPGPESDPPHAIVDATLCQEGKLLAAIWADHRITVTDLGGGGTRSIRTEVTGECIRFTSPNDLFCGLSDGRVAAVSIDPLKVVSTERIVESRITALVASGTDGKAIAVDEVGNLWSVQLDGEILHSVPIGSTSVAPAYAAAFEPQQGLIAFAGTSGMLDLWKSASDYCRVRVVELPSPQASCVCFSPDGSLVAAMSGLDLGGHLVVSRVNGLEEIFRIADDEIWTTAAFLDDKHIAFTGGTDVVYVANVLTSRIHGTYRLKLKTEWSPYRWLLRSGMDRSFVVVEVSGEYSRWAF